jgi:putative multiple sugar transport system substrate-binding protein
MLKITKPIIQIAALATVSVLALSGCGRGDTAAASTTSSASGFNKDSVIGVALPQKTSENWVLAEKLFNEQLTADGYKATVQFANGGVTDQQNQISAMITKGAKVIIVGAIDGSQLGTQLKQAKEAGATVIAYDRMLQNTDAVDYHVAYDSFKIGQLQARALLEGMQAKKPSGPYNIELFAGSPDDANAKIFFDGAMDVLKSKIDDGSLKVVSGQKDYNQVVTQGWKAENAQKRMDTLLTAGYTNENLDGVLSPNDTIARTIITSVKAAGKALPVVTGQDSDIESVKSIMAGEQYCTINKDIRAQVGGAIQMVNDLQAGKIPATNSTSDTGTKKVPAQLLAPTVVIAKNAAEVYADNPTLAPLTK